MITQCPACHTMFRVVPDQLRLAQGWVRCGTCSKVFDANEHLQALPESSEPATAQHALQPEPRPKQQSEAQPAQELEAKRELDGGGDRAMTVDVLLDDLPPPSPVAAAEPAVAASPAPAAEPSHPAPPVEEGEPAWYAEYKQAFDHPPERSEQDEVDSSLEDMSFVRQARQRARWDSAAARGLLALLAAALTVLLVLQMVFHQRDRIAATQPQLRPLLEWLCRPIACAVQPLRQIEAVVIDNSSFNRQGADTYRLTVGLRNSSPVPVAAPWLELTLTDASDQAVLRRVLNDKELGLAPAAVIAGGSEWSTTLTLTLTADATTARIAGYRLLAFYP